MKERTKKVIRYTAIFAVIFSLIVTIFYLLFSYWEMTLNIIITTSMIVAMISLIAAIYNFRNHISSLFRDFWSGVRHLKGLLDPVISIFLLFHSIVITSIYYTGLGGGYLKIAITVALCHAIAGLSTVSEQEKGVVILFGKILKEIDSGLFFAPWPMRVRKISKTGIKIDFGTLNEEEKRKLDLADPSPSWYVLEFPMRINWGDIDSYRDEQNRGLTDADKVAFENDPLAKRMTTDPHLFFIMKVFDFPRLITEVGGFDEAVDRIRDVCNSVLSEYAGKTFVAKALSEIGELNLKLKERVEELIGDPEGNRRLSSKSLSQNQSWGIDITDLVIKSLGVHHDTNKALVKRSVDIATADGEARATIRRSVAEATRIVNEGRSKADAQMALNRAEEDKIQRVGKATADALSAQAKAARTKGGRVVLQTDAVKEGLRSGKAVFIPSGVLEGVVSAVLAGKEALKAVDENPSKTTKP